MEFSKEVFYKDILENNVLFDQITKKSFHRLDKKNKGYIRGRDLFNFMRVFAFLFQIPAPSKNEVQDIVN